MQNKMAIKKNKENSYQHGSYRSALLTRSLKILAFCLFLFVLFFALQKVYFNALPIKTMAFTKSVVHLDKTLLAKRLLQINKGGLLAIDLDLLHTEVMSNPWIKSLKIRKKWPETLIFSIQEYRPMAKFNHRYLVESGILLNSDKGFIGDQLLQVNVQKIEQNEMQRLELYKKLNAMKEILQGSNMQVESFTLDRNNSWSGQVNQQFNLTIGRKNRIERVVRFAAIFSAIENAEQIRSVDLRYESGVAVKYASLLSDKQKG